MYVLNTVQAMNKTEKLMFSWNILVVENKLQNKI